MGNNPIKDALEKADAQDRRRQQQVQRQKEVIDRLLGDDKDGAIHDVLLQVSRAEGFIVDSGLWDKYAKEVLDRPLAEEQPQDD